MDIYSTMIYTYVHIWNIHMYNIHMYTCDILYHEFSIIALIFCCCTHIYVWQIPPLKWRFFTINYCRRHSFCFEELCGWTCDRRSTKRSSLRPSFWRTSAFTKKSFYYHFLRFAGKISIQPSCGAIYQVLMWLWFYGFIKCVCEIINVHERRLMRLSNP